MRTSETAGSGKPRQSIHIPTNIEKIEAKIWTSLFPLFSFDQQHCCVCSTTKTALQSTTLSSATYGIHQKRKWGKMKDIWPHSIRPLWPHFELTCFHLNISMHFKDGPIDRDLGSRYLLHLYGIFVTFSLSSFFRHFSEWLLPAPSCEPFYFLGTELGEQGDAGVGHLDININ